MPPFRKIALPVVALAGILLSWHQAPAQPSAPPVVGEELRRARADFANGGARRLTVNWNRCIEQVRASQDANAAERCMVYGYGALLADDTAAAEGYGPGTRRLTPDIVAPVQMEMLDIMGIPASGLKLWLERYRRWVFEGRVEEPGTRNVGEAGPRGGMADLAGLAADQTPLAALRQPEIADALRRVVGRQTFARLKDYSFGSPMEFNGHVTIGRTCVPHNCGVAEARYVFSANDVWVAIIDGKRMRLYGGPPPRAQELLMRDRNQVVWKGPVEDMSRPIITAVTSNRVASEPPPPPPPPVQPDSDISEIPLRKHGGTFVVPVMLNNTMTLPFMIDSGSSDVSLSPGVVEKLIQSGTLLKADFLGKQTYSLADGSKVSNDTFRLRVLKVGDREIRDVLCSVSSEEGGLLLGQSFLTRFRSWSIDNQRHMLVLK